MNKLEMVEQYVQQKFEKTNEYLNRVEETGMDCSESYYNALGRMDVIEDILAYINGVKNDE